MQERCETLWPPLHSPPSVCHWPTIRSDWPKAFSDATSDDRDDDDDGYDTADRVDDDGDTDDGDDAAHQQSNPIQNFLRLGGGEKKSGHSIVFSLKRNNFTFKEMFLTTGGNYLEFCQEPRCWTGASNPLLMVHDPHFPKGRKPLWFPHKELISSIFQTIEPPPDPPAQYVWSHTNP